MADEPQLQEGSGDEDWVRYLQETLVFRGYDPGPVDGIFGPLTRAGVEAFQADNVDIEGNQLAGDGIVGPLTWGALTSDADDTGGGDDAGEAFSLDHSVNLVMQTTNHTCWAAGCAMLLDQSEQDIIDAVGNAGGDGADEPEMQVIASTLGLEIVAPMSMTPEGWGQLLNRGPVMVGIPGHYIVVAGIKSDGTYAGTQLHVFDPATGELWADYQVVEDRYEIDAEAGANLLQR